MPSATQSSRAVMFAAMFVPLVGCSGEGSGSGPATSQTGATTAAAPTAAVTAATSATAAAPTASAEPHHDCPKNSSGEGSLKSPCEAKGKERMMEVTWTGKMDDNGPSFRVINKGTLTILYGKIVVYFYDKAGKQLQPGHPCSGNLFSGIMKPGEKAVVTFSCVSKKDVPEGAAAIEGEMQVVGFADASEKKSEFFWKNADLTPDTRPKGGIK